MQVREGGSRGRAGDLGRSFQVESRHAASASASSLARRRASSASACSEATTSDRRRPRIRSARAWWSRAASRRWRSACWTTVGAEVGGEPVHGLGDRPSLSASRSPRPSAAATRSCCSRAWASLIESAGGAGCLDGGRSPPGGRVTLVDLIGLCGDAELQRGDLGLDGVDSSQGGVGLLGVHGPQRGVRDRGRHGAACGGRGGHRGGRGVPCAVIALVDNGATSDRSVRRALGISVQRRRPVEESGLEARFARASTTVVACGRMVVSRLRSLAPRPP